MNWKKEKYRRKIDELRPESWNAGVELAQHLVLRGMQVDLAKRGEEDELRCCYHLINRGLTSSTSLVNEIFA